MDLNWQVLSDVTRSPPTSQGTELRYLETRQKIVGQAALTIQSRFLGEEGYLPGEPVQARGSSLLTSSRSTLVPREKFNCLEKVAILGKIKYRMPK